MHQPRLIPIRRKLLIRTTALLLGVFGVMLVSIILQSLRMIAHNTGTMNTSIHRALMDKGIALTSNTGLALVGMAENNAFTDMEQLLGSTISKSPDVVYAIYMTKKRIPWVMASSENPSGTVSNPRPLNDPMARWASGLVALDSKESLYHDVPVIEFASPVRNQQEILGWVRYGVSTAAMRHAQEAAARSGIADRNTNLAVLSGLAAVTLGLALFMARRFSDHLADRIKNVVESTRLIAEGNFDVPLVVSDTSDELGMLGNDVNRMRQSLKVLTASLADQERLRQEMALARRIQTALLPPNIAGLRPDLELAALMLTAEEVGGDYYDAAVDRDGALWLTIGDVSGHGVTPGMIMMMAQTAHSAVRSGGTASPTEMIVRLNRTLHENVAERLQSDHYMTFVALRYEGDGLFTHAGAHLDLLIHRQATNQVERRSTEGIWLAVEADISKDTVAGSFQLEIGDTLILYTDGLTEALSPSGAMLGISGLAELIKQHAHLATSTLAQTLVRDVCDWCADRRKDDMTIMAVRRID